MLEYTFRHIFDNGGEVVERELWNAGIRTWSDFLSAKLGDLPVPARTEHVRHKLEENVNALRDGNSAYFTRRLPREESWRMYADFRHNAAFLDIETTGFSKYRDLVTLVGILDKDGYHSFINGSNLSDLREAVERYDLIVTYNGESFDLPFIEHHMGTMFTSTPHIDLKFTMWKIDQKGGLKAIEQRLGVGRPSELSAIDGRGAVKMWWWWKNGWKGALETLIRYNAEDVYSLPKLADIGYNRLAAKCEVGVPQLDGISYPEEDLAYDSRVVRRLRRRR